MLAFSKQVGCDLPEILSPNFSQHKLFVSPKSDNHTLIFLAKLLVSPKFDNPTLIFLSPISVSFERLSVADRQPKGQLQLSPDFTVQLTIVLYSYQARYLLSGQPIS